MSATIENMSQLEQRMDRIEKLLIVQAKELLTPEETAMLMGVGVDMVYRLTSGAKPKIGFTKPGGKLKYIEKSEVLNYMRQNRTKGAVEIDEEADIYLTKHKAA
jgi:excisionase family DNA binding protein